MSVLVLVREDCVKDEFVTVRPNLSKAALVFCLYHNYAELVVTMFAVTTIILHLCLIYSSILAYTIQHSKSFDLVSRDDTTALPRPYLGSVPYGAAIVNCAVPGTVALTFDDGPGPYTARLLDTLATNNIKATFLIVGNRNNSETIEQLYPDLIRRTHYEGHQSASHTWNHLSLEALPTRQRFAEMQRNEAVFINILGFFPTYMRPPYGFCYTESGCLRDMARLGYHVIDWSVDTKDYRNNSLELIQNSIDRWNAMFAGSNSQNAAFPPLMHDVHRQTVEMLTPYMIGQIRRRGFRMVTVGECSGDPPQNWYRTVDAA